MSITHAYWLYTEGPEDYPGVSLRYVEDEKERIEKLRAKARAQGDERWLRNINEMARRNKAIRWTTPEIGWWVSRDDYANGVEGFGGITKDIVAHKHPELRIHANRVSAIAAAGYVPGDLL